MGIIGLIVMTIGISGLYFMTPDTPIYLLIFCLIVLGLGLGAAMPVFTLTVQNAVAPQQIGVATASSQLFRNLGGTIGIAVMGSVMSASITKKMTELAGTNGQQTIPVSTDPALAEKFALFSNPQNLLDQPKIKAALKSLPPESQVVFSKILDTVQEALSYAITTTFLVSAIMAAIAVVLALFLKEIPLRSGKNMGQKVTEMKPKITNK